jgi:hypothetical protein
MEGVGNLYREHQCRHMECSICQKNLATSSLDFHYWVMHGKAPNSNGRANNLGHQLAECCMSFPWLVRRVPCLVKGCSAQHLPIIISTGTSITDTSITSLSSLRRIASSSASNMACMSCMAHWPLGTSKQQVVGRGQSITYSGLLPRMPPWQVKLSSLSSGCPWIGCLYSGILDNVSHPRMMTGQPFTGA